MEEEPCLSFTNLKRAATDLWVAMFQIGSSTDLKKRLYLPGPYFNENLTYLVSKLENENLLEKELSLYFSNIKTNLMPLIVFIFVFRKNKKLFSLLTSCSSFLLFLVLSTLISRS